MSKLQDRVVEILKTHPKTKSYTILTEVPLKDLCGQKKGRQRVDILIKQLRLVIEVDGPHHKRPIRYGGSDKGKVLERYMRQRLLDIEKDRKLLEAGFTVWRVSSIDELVSKLDQL